MSENILPSIGPTVGVSGIFENEFVNLLGATDFNSNLDWLFDPVPGDDVVDLTDLYLPNDIILDDEDSHQHLIDQSPQETYSYDDTKSPPRRNSTILELPTMPLSEDSCSPDDPWPMEWHAEYQHRPLELPDLGAGDSNDDGQFFSRFFSTWALRPCTVDTLIQYIKMPSQQSPWQPINLKHFPSKEKLEHCIDRYFAHFQQTWPIIHQPTFDPARDLTVTLAVACIGVLYTHLPEAKTFSNTLSELNRRLLLFLAEYDPRYVRTEPYLTTQLLQGIHGYCSGNKRLFELSESFRNNLVHHAKCINLFRPRPEAKSDSLSDTSVEQRWKNWIRQEQLCRLGWAVYKYDASVAYLHNNRPFLSIGDMHLDLPCPSQFWNAESAHCWLSMLPSPSEIPKSQSFRWAMRTLFNNTPDPTEKVKEEEHRYIVILTLVRMIWTLKEMMSSPISDLMRERPENSTPRLLAAVDLFSQSSRILSASLTTVELARAIHTQQVVHVAHLYGAGGLMNWLYPLLRDGNRATLALTQLNEWAAAKPESVREAAYHSAQILSLARTYPSNSPIEPFLIFHAGTVLFYLAKLLPKCISSTEKFIAVKLDHLSTCEDDEESFKLVTWLKTGQTQKVSLQGISSLCCDDGRRQSLEQTVEILRRRPVWGVAESFVKVILRLRDTLPQY
ncbi:hypothetical protein F5884DRAFT_899041 [Xylogone sp. PMI_703]|nr:hypothetical protein F5884DRAFT_899041 [Xylogone sp. PMI_703]